MRTSVHHPVDADQQWLVYVRWESGLRETIRTQAPAQVAGHDRLWVLACMPVPAVAVLLDK